MRLERGPSVQPPACLSAGHLGRPVREAERSRTKREARRGAPATRTAWPRVVSLLSAAKSVSSLPTRAHQSVSSDAHHNRATRWRPSGRRARRMDSSCAPARSAARSLQLGPLGPASVSLSLLWRARNNGPVRALAGGSSGAGLAFLGPLTRRGSLQSPPPPSQLRPACPPSGRAECRRRETGAQVNRNELNRIDTKGGRPARFADAIQLATRKSPWPLSRADCSRASILFAPVGRPLVRACVCMCLCVPASVRLCVGPAQASRRPGWSPPNTGEASREARQPHLLGSAASLFEYLCAGAREFPPARGLCPAGPHCCRLAGKAPAPRAPQEGSAKEGGTRGPATFGAPRKNVTNAGPALARAPSSVMMIIFTPRLNAVSPFSGARGRLAARRNWPLGRARES